MLGSDCGRIHNRRLKIKEKNKMKNWNSKLGEYTDIAKDSTKIKVERAQKLRAEGKSVKEISEKCGMSESRIREYLRK
jgi:DNA-binding NarL/FixJ family response regulator